MTAEETKTVLEKHKEWLLDDAPGQQADLRLADLRGAKLEVANLRGANLRGANLEWANLEWADLEGANLEGANLEWANLKGANLRGAKLEGADLRGADLDYSSGFSFRCGSFGVKIDLRIAAQMAYHFCRMECEDKEVKDAQNALVSLANKFHRVQECGKIEVTA